MPPLRRPRSHSSASEGDHSKATQLTLTELFQHRREQSSVESTLMQQQQLQLANWMQYDVRGRRLAPRPVIVRQLADSSADYWDRLQKFHVRDVQQLPSCSTSPVASSHDLSHTAAVLPLQLETESHKCRILGVPHCVPDEQLSFSKPGAVLQILTDAGDHNNNNNQFFVVARDPGHLALYESEALLLSSSLRRSLPGMCGNGETPPSSPCLAFDMDLKRPNVSYVTSLDWHSQNWGGMFGLFVTAFQHPTLDLYDLEELHEAHAVPVRVWELHPRGSPGEEGHHGTVYGLCQRSFPGHGSAAAVQLVGTSAGDVRLCDERSAKALLMCEVVQPKKSFVSTMSPVGGVASPATGGRVTCLAPSGFMQPSLSAYVLGGTSRGQVHLWDVRSATTPVCSLQISNGEDEVCAIHQSGSLQWVCQTRFCVVRVDLAQGSLAVATQPTKASTTTRPTTNTDIRVDASLRRGPSFYLPEHLDTAAMTAPLAASSQTRTCIDRPAVLTVTGRSTERFPEPWLAASRVTARDASLPSYDGRQSHSQFRLATRWRPISCCIEQNTLVLPLAVDDVVDKPLSVATFPALSLMNLHPPLEKKRGSDTVRRVGGLADARDRDRRARRQAAASSFQWANDLLEHPEKKQKDDDSGEATSTTTPTSLPMHLYCHNMDREQSRTFRGAITSVGFLPQCGGTLLLGTASGDLFVA